MLSGKKVLLGVTGSIAAYKSLQLVRTLTKAGAAVNVVLTASARKFVPPLTLKVFSGHPVLSDLFDPANDMAHLQLAEDADLILIAPVTAHFIAKMATGFADDLLSTLLLAAQSPVLIAPAMDLGMWDHPAVQGNITLLKKRGVQVIEPEWGLLASGKEGPGRLANEDSIIKSVLQLLSNDQPALAGEFMLVTAGPTEEAIDPVRFISNRSSGKMGYALAARAAQWGARVTLISGPTSLAEPVGVERISVRSADEMAQAFQQKCDESSIIIMTAAVSDYRPLHPEKQKIKKNSGLRTLELEETPDILEQRPTAQKSDDRRNQLVIGFAAETENLLENAKKKLKKKRLDLIVANDITQAGAGFDVDTNIVHLITPDGQISAIPKMSKLKLAGKILEAIVKLRASQPPFPKTIAVD